MPKTVVLVTGAAGDIGAATVNHLMGRGWHVAPHAIRVNAVSPGPIATPILDKVFPDKNVAAQVREKMIDMMPMKRFGTSEEIAKAVLFLAFDATFTTGLEIPVDGGWSQL